MATSTVKLNGITLMTVNDTTAVVSDVVQGKSFTAVDGSKVTGTSPGGSVEAISITDTSDSAGGIVRTITAIDISDTTAVANDVASGKYFYTAAGVKTAGAATDDAANPIPAPLKDVVFVDYDGEVVAQYTADEFLALAALPANPSHTGLTAQGWNWTLQDAKEYVQNYGCLCIGQNYVTNDGKTRIYIRVNDMTNFGQIGIDINATNGANIDWGDGHTTTWSSSGNKTYYHTYTNNGDYVINIWCNTGTYVLGGGFTSGYAISDSCLSRGIYAVELGANISSLYRRTFLPAYNLRTISIPNTITQFSTGGTQGENFSGGSVKCVVLPSGTTAIYSLTTSAKFISFPKSLSTLSGGGGGRMRMFVLPEAAWGTGVTQAGYQITRAERISIPGTYSTMGSGTVTNSFLRSNSYCRTFIVPASVTNMNANALNGGKGINELHMRPTSPPTLANATNCLPPNVSVIYVPYSADHSILEAYQTAENWSTYASQMQEEPQ